MWRAECFGSVHRQAAAGSVNTKSGCGLRAVLVVWDSLTAECGGNSSAYL